MANIEEIGKLTTTLKTIGPPLIWLWTDDNTPVSASAGLVFIGKEVWDDYGDDSKAQYRPVSLNGLMGRGLVRKNLLLICPR